MPLPSLRSSIALAFIFVSHSGFLSTASASDWYVDAAEKNPLQDGSSWSTAWTSFKQIRQSSLSSGDVIWIMSGTYDERFTITRGGTMGHPITYVGTGPTKPVLRGIDGTTANDIAIINLEFTQLSTVDDYNAIALRGNERWLIEDNFIHDTYDGGVLTAYRTASSFITVRHNTFADIGSVDGGSGTPIVIAISGDHNLIEYNSIIHSMDRCRVFGTGNVVRNNYWGPTDSNLYPNSKPYPNHTDGFQSFEGGNPLIQFLYERNFDIDNTDTAGHTNAHGFLVQDEVGTNNFHWYILRFNILIRPGGGAYSFQNVSRTYLYNSTFVGIQHGSTRVYQTAGSYTYPKTYSPATSDLADVRNNTWDFCPNCMDPHGIISKNYWPTNFTSASQHSYNLGRQVVLPSGASPGNLPHLDPLFTDGTGVAGHDDYTLQSTSPLRNAGAQITAAVGDASNSTHLTLTDSKRLFDGWGIADADFIRIGNGDYVQISSIDYGSDAVVLSAPRSWHDGDRVFVKGSEDIGALPFAYVRSTTITNTTPPILRAGMATLSAACDNPDAVRKVEFLVDRIPVGESFSPPYTVPWLSDGARHEIEARAYSAWASRLPSTSQVNIINAQ